MGFQIIGLGTALPTHFIKQEDAANFAKTINCKSEESAQLLDAIYKRTKIHKRGSVLLSSSTQEKPQQSFYEITENFFDFGPTTEERMKRYSEEAFPLVLVSAQKAILESGILVQKITHLVTVSCTGFSAPGIDIALIKELGLNPTVSRTHIGFMGCHGSINGLRIAAALAEKDKNACVLLCAVELCSLHFSYGSDPEKIVANGLFADGAASLVGTSKNNAGAFLKLNETASCIFPNSEEAMSWQIGNFGFEMSLSSSVPSLIEKNLRPFLEKWLSQNKLSIEKIGSWAIHPGGPKILDAVANSLSLSEDELAISYQILTEYGNMSSPTLLFILDRLRKNGAQRPYVALGFGPGLALEAALFG